MRAETRSLPVLEIEGDLAAFQVRTVSASMAAQSRGQSARRDESLRSCTEAGEMLPNEAPEIPRSPDPPLTTPPTTSVGDWLPPLWRTRARHLLCGRENFVTHLADSSDRRLRMLQPRLARPPSQRLPHRPFIFTWLSLLPIGPLYLLAVVISRGLTTY
jgi:hypothetical protein